MMLEEERERIHNALEKYNSHSQYFLPEEDLNRVNYLLSCLCDFLNADAEPVRHGKWILKGVREPLPRDYPPCYGEDEYDEETHSIIVKHWFCSECDYDASDSFKPKDNYCPHCGAKMDEVEDNGKMD